MRLIRSRRWRGSHWTSWKFKAPACDHGRRCVAVTRSVSVGTVKRAYTTFPECPPLRPSDFCVPGRESCAFGLKARRTGKFAHSNIKPLRTENRGPGRCGMLAGGCAAAAAAVVNFMIARPKLNVVMGNMPARPVTMGARGVRRCPRLNQPRLRMLSRHPPRSLRHNPGMMKIAEELRHFGPIQSAPVRSYLLRFSPPFVAR